MSLRASLEFVNQRPEQICIVFVYTNRCLCRSTTNAAKVALPVVCFTIVNVYYLIGHITTHLLKNTSGQRSQ